MSARTCSRATPRTALRIWLPRSGAEPMLRGRCGFSADRVLQCIPERLQRRRVDVRARDGGLVDRLAHLIGACRAHRPLGPVEGKTTIVPLETAVGDDAAR